MSQEREKLLFFEVERLRMIIKTVHDELNEYAIDLDTRRIQRAREMTDIFESVSNEDLAEYRRLLTIKNRNADESKKLSELAKKISVIRQNEPTDDPVLIELRDIRRKYNI